MGAHPTGIASHRQGGTKPYPIRIPPHGLSPPSTQTWVLRDKILGPRFESREAKDRVGDTDGVGLGTTLPVTSDASGAPMEPVEQLNIYYRGGTSPGGDHSNLKSIQVDINEGTAWVQSGATIGELSYIIAEKSQFHAFTAGICPTVGVRGHFNGGGSGFLTRKYGLSADNVVDARVVNANGKILSKESMEEDFFFWAIRGGGASFGVVLSWKINLVAIPPNVTVFTSPRVAYLNVRDLDLGQNEMWNNRTLTYDEAKIWGNKCFKNNFDRLVKVKRRVDPDNFFRYEQSIPPSFT
ncbi:hypothetical protein Sjap_023905 [Stephania japonica]|uniref:FAD-binding PCMH-type domain-containing protein n=1 Tax=Stephania japonica TaxID=461633 RepID=A0AAP0EJU0_9MAGN